MKIKQWLGMLFPGFAVKIKFFSFYFPLAVLLLLTYGLLSLMDLHSEGILKTTKYVLTHEDGMGFYDAPGGTEQMVMYLDGNAGVESEAVERKEGERWMEFDKIRVQKPEDGWAKVDIGDNGAPLYVEAQYVNKQTVRILQGRKGESNILDPIGPQNLPPVAAVFIIGCFLYFIMLYPWWMILKRDTASSGGNMWTEKQVSALAYTISAYIIGIVLLKFIAGYNVGLRWFTDCGMLFIILNVIVGLVGSIGLAVVLFRYYSDNVEIGDRALVVFKRFGVRGFLLLVGGLYFILIFLGVAVGVVAILAAIYLLINLLPAALAGLYGGSSVKGGSGKAVHNCCSTCSRFNGRECHEHPMLNILDPDAGCCGDYTRGC